MSLEEHPPMTAGGIGTGMTPPHPGTFIRTEALEEPGLSVPAAARIPGVRGATRLGCARGPAKSTSGGISRHDPRPARNFFEISPIMPQAAHAAPDGSCRCL